MFLVYVSLIFYLLNITTNSAPVLQQKYSLIPSTKALDFMKKYGYIEDDDGDSEALYTEEGISEVIKTVQRFGGIEQTGIIDNATLQLMSSPRCGVPDIIRHKRQRRFVIRTGWPKRSITYFVANWSPKLGEYTVVKNIQKALDTWGSYGRLNFRRTLNPDADIIVTFGREEHGDMFPFDGPGVVLAHAFFPNEYSDMGGDIHFDDDENWVDRSETGTEEGVDFYPVALHELGHSLGLAHSPVVDAIMFPYYKGDVQLSYDDILGIYKLYISRRLRDDNDNNNEYETTTKIYSVEPTRETKRSDNPVTDYTTEYTTFTRIESTSRATTIHELFPVTTAHAETTITYEGGNETVDEHKNHDETHTVPENNYPSLPNICDGYVDAVATMRDELFVFKDQFIWRYTDKRKLEPGYPIPLTEMFPNLPDSVKKIDAAYERPDGMIILFTGKVFWIFDGTNFLDNNPRPLTDYGLPDYLTEIDAVQNWGRNRKTYFYKSDRFWRYNETSETMDPGYPLHIERWRGVPENLDAATTWKDGITYFFKGELFWKFDNDWVIVTEQSPLPTAQIWFGCEEEENKMMLLFPQ